MLDKERRKIAGWTAPALASLVTLGASAMCLVGCQRSEPPAMMVGLLESATSNSYQPLSTEMEGRVETFCGDCHRLPKAASFDRDRWHFEVKRGYEFYAKSGRNDLDPPPLDATLNYFRKRAPPQLTFPQSPEATGALPVRFEQEKLFLHSGVGVLPEIGYLRWAQLAPDTEPVMLATDLRYGHVVAIDLKPNDRKPPQVLAQLRNPGRIEVCDLDNDGQMELLVGDLASYLPSDHQRGRLVLLRRQPGEERYESLELLSGMGRISDVRAGHLDGDGKLDLAIAEFGWRDTGRLLVARNVSESDRLAFALQQIDDRPGALNVRLHDFGGDGTLDVASLYSQEYESFDVYDNAGSVVGSDLQSRMQFTRQNLWQADDLTFGCSGMELVDLNQDRAMDVLITNGDAFDNAYVTPWHGVQWLENRGGMNFVCHRLTDMPGAYCAQAGDFDGDGQLDILVTSRLPGDRFPSNLPRLASIVFLHQHAPGQFKRYTLEWESPFYPSLAIGDFDANGQLDFAVAPGPYVGELRQGQEESHFLTIWWNQTSR